MSCILATLTAQPGRTQELEALLRRLVSETSREPGAVVYEVFSPEEPATAFTVCERYVDASARADHLASPHLAAALRSAKDLLACPPDVRLMRSVSGIGHEIRAFRGQPVRVALLPVGPVSLVYAQTPRGVLACGAIDPAALERFGVAAARVKPKGSSVGSYEDLLAGEVREANAPARALGVLPGMTGEEALARLQAL